MYCRQEKTYGGELVMQIIMILRYLNFSFSSIDSSMTTMLAKEYQVNFSLNHRIVISL